MLSYIFNYTQVGFERKLQKAMQYSNQISLRIHLQLHILLYRNNQFVQKGMHFSLMIVNEKFMSTVKNGFIYIYIF